MVGVLSPFFVFEVCYFSVDASRVRTSAEGRQLPPPMPPENRAPPHLEADANAFVFLLQCNQVSGWEVILLCYLRSGDRRPRIGRSSEIDAPRATGSVGDRFAAPNCRNGPTELDEEEDGQRLPPTPNYANKSIRRARRAALRSLCSGHTYGGVGAIGVPPRLSNLHKVVLLVWQPRLASRESPGSLVAVIAAFGRWRAHGGNASSVPATGGPDLAGVE